MRMVVKDGYNGRGKQRTQMSGHIKLDWQMVGFHEILPISNSRIFVEMVHRTGTFFFFFLLSHFLHDLTLILIQRSVLMCPEGLELHII